MLELEDIQKNTGKLLKKIRFSERNTLSTKNRFYKGDILFCKLRPYLKKTIIADEDGFCSTEIIPLRISKFITPHYLSLVLRSDFILSYTNEKSYGMDMPRLGTEDGKNMPIPLPSLDEQNDIINYYLNFKSKLNLLEKQNNDLNEIKKKIIEKFKNPNLEIN